MLTALICLVVSAVSAHDWQSGNNGQVMWASGCDFLGNDISNQPSSGEDCGGICLSNPSCTHFSWGNGVCYLKKANHPTATDLNGAVCGWVTVGRPEHPDGNDLIFKISR